MENKTRLLYSVIMLLVALLGTTGNVLTILVLCHKKHRKKAISPLMINLAAANVLICVFGYPVSINIVEMWTFDFKKEHYLCDWVAFISATCGFAAIISLSFMSLLTYRKVTKLRQVTQRDKSWIIFVALVWCFSILLAIPPFFGWNRFISMESGVSCHPDWVSQNIADVSYIGFIVVCGFIVPLAVICYSNVRVNRYIRTSIRHKFRARRKSSIKRRTLRINNASVASFVLSWTPYCVVSLGSTFAGASILSPNMSLIPEVMAKASVVYNPMIYWVINPSFRSTFRDLVHCRSRNSASGGQWSRVTSDSTNQHKSIRVRTFVSFMGSRNQNTNGKWSEKSDSQKEDDTAL